MGVLAKKGKSGIIGMKEKALLINGTFNIKSSTGKGTTVSLEFDSSSTP
jgi:signal transduction histidine kinase